MRQQRKCCTKCNKSRPLRMFSTRKTNRELRSGEKYSWCKTCFREQWERYGPKKLKQYREQRRLNINRDKWIVQDSIKSDRRRGQNSNITREFVKSLIEKGCVYCGISSNKTKMTLDRIDNKLGHLKSNVKPACSNCNLTRGNMPYKAWLTIAKAMRKARKAGLFDGWMRHTPGVGQR